MRRTTTRASRLLAGVVVATLALVTVALLDHEPRSTGAHFVETSTTTAPGQNGNGADKSADPKAFTVTGSVTDLYPGARKAFAVVVKNPNSVAIRVTSVTVAVGAPGGACPSTVLTVGPLAAPLLVTANGQATGSLVASLSASAPGACQGRTFPLTYGGAAEKQ